MGKIKDFIQKPTLLGEITRFLLVGGVSTVLDFLVMGITMYVLAPDRYDSFISVFFGSAEDPTGLAAIVGTGLGFIFGLVINYLFSILFVFNESTFARSAKGIITFALFSTGGLILHEVGMLLFFGWFGINEWIVKIFMTFVVLVYNFTTRRTFVFRKNPRREEQAPQPHTVVEGPAIISKPKTDKPAEGPSSLDCSDTVTPPVEATKFSADSPVVDDCIAATEAALTAQPETAPTDVKIDDNRPIADDLTSQEGASDTAEGDNNED